MGLGDLFRKAVGAPVRALIPKNPWLRVLLVVVPVLLLLSLFEPVFRLLTKGISALFGLFEPFLANPSGRLVLLNILLLLLVWIGYVLLRNSLRRTRSGLLLNKHLLGVRALLHGESRRAEELFETVVRSKGPMPKEYEHLQADARLKLARLALQNGSGNDAMAWLAPVREHKLPKELRRSWMQQRIEVYLTQGENLPETLRSELDAALTTFPDDGRLLGLRRRIAVLEEDLVAAVSLQERVVKHAGPAVENAERQRLLADYDRLAASHLEAGDLNDAMSVAKKALRLVPDHPGALLVRGEVMLARGQTRKAMRVWGESRSPEGLQRMAALLNEQPGLLEPRELLECSPTTGGLLLVARELARAGEQEKAIRAARRATAGAELSPTVALLLAEVMRLCGRSEDAAKLGQQAGQHLLGRQGSA